MSSDPEKQPLWGTDKNFAALLANYAISLPTADHAAGGVSRNVCGVGEFFVGYIDLDETGNFLANVFC